MKKWKKNIPTKEEGTTETKEEEIDILQEVEMIMKKFPKADANRVYALLECREKDKDRVKAVMVILKERHTDIDDSEKTDNRKPGAIKRVLSESAVADDPLYKDMLQIAKIFPHIDKNEIYALCEVRIHAFGKFSQWQVEPLKFRMFGWRSLKKVRTCKICICILAQSP